MPVAIVQKCCVQTMVENEQRTCTEPESNMTVICWEIVILSDCDNIVNLQRMSRHWDDQVSRMQGQTIQPSLSQFLLGGNMLWLVMMVPEDQSDTWPPRDNNARKDLAFAINIWRAQMQTMVGRLYKPQRHHWSERSQEGGVPKCHFRNAFLSIF